MEMRGDVTNQRSNDEEREAERRVTCPKCKVKWPDDLKFCGICGREMPASSGAEYISENHGGSGSSESRAIKVNSIPEEYDLMRRLECACGGKFVPNGQMVYERQEKMYDELGIKCEQCGNEHALIFDVSSFFGKFYAALGLDEEEGWELCRQFEVTRKRRRNRRILGMILVLAFLAIAALWFLWQYMIF